MTETRLPLGRCDLCACLVPLDELSDGRECGITHCTAPPCEPCAPCALDRKRDL